MSRTIVLSRSSPDFTLTPLKISDAEFLLALLQSPDYLKFIGDRGVDTLAEAQAYLDGYFLASERKHGFGYVVVRDVQNSPIGMVGLMKRDYLDYPDLGFAFLPISSGKGYAITACETYLQSQRDCGKIETIEAFTDEKNCASQRLLGRLGFELTREFAHPDDGLTMMLYKLVLS